MNSPQHSKLLHCPLDQEPLVYDSQQNSLSCLVCNRVIPIKDGIPRFIEDDHLASFGRQWNRYEVAHLEEDRQTFQAKTGFELKDLKGKRVLDAGCGGGRYAKLVAAAGAELVAVDLTHAVEKARALCQRETDIDLNQVQFLQADLKALPLEPASFDYVFSIGVMHHDVNTRDLFDAVAKLVKPGGYYAVWLYRRNQNWQERVNSLLRSRTIKMSPERLEKWCRLGAFLGSIPLLNKTLNKVINFSSHSSYENRVCDTFDWYAPQYQHHHTLAELLDWFEAAGFEDLEVLPPEKNGACYNWAYEKNLIIGSGVNVQGRRKKQL
ncbi:MAG: methyltransferase domain-containing protein [Planctomycetaceae bacterium]